MNPRTSTEPVTNNPSGVVLVNGVDESVSKPAPTARLRPPNILSLPSDESEGTPEEIDQSCREEIIRRLESIQNGTVQFYTVEETLSHMDEAIAESELL